MQLTSPPRRYIQEGTTAKVVTVSLSNLRKPGDTGAIPALDNMRQFSRLSLLFPIEPYWSERHSRMRSLRNGCTQVTLSQRDPTQNNFKKGKGGGEPDEQ